MADIDIGKILEALNSKADTDLNNTQAFKKTGGELRGDILRSGLLARSPLEDEVMIKAGSELTNEDGALVVVYGKNGFNAGGFLARAASSNGVVRDLLGLPDGTLRWVGKHVLREEAGSLGENGYIKFNTGLIIQWGHVYSSATEYINVTFPVPFWGHYAITKNYPSNHTSAVQYRELGFWNKTATGATAFNQAGVSSGFDWIAIGY